MQRAPEDDELPNSLMPFIWRYLRRRKLYLAGFFLVSLIWASEMSLSPYLLKVIIDTVIKYSHDHTKMLTAISIPALLYASMSIILNMTFRFYDYINLRLYPEIKSTVTKDMFAYLMNHSYAFFQNNFTGSLTRKIFDMEDIEKIVSIFNEWFYPRLFAIIISSVTLCLVVSPIFGAILFTWATSFVYLSYRAARNSAELARQCSEAGSKMNGTLTDSISNIMSTKLFANIPNELLHVNNDIDQLVVADRKLQWKNLKVNFIQGLGVTALISSMLGTLIYGQIHGWVSPGDFALVLMLSVSFIMSVYAVGQEMLKFSKVVGKCNQALSFIRLPHEIKDSPDARPLVVTKGEIKFENVGFHYENNNTLFENLNVTINPGEKVGLVGYSGSGKSTFIKLILRLIQVQSGSISIDGQDIKQVKKSTLRKQVGTIPQEPDLFHRSIMENIRFARVEASDAEVIDAAKKARCHEFICELPEQYQSLVGERGIKLSGGQKQRIAIARAFLKQAPILLLDEATSSLDSITEGYIQESLHAVIANKTTIVIAHRLSTLKDMDRILVFVNGKIVEDGSLDTLLQDSQSHFYRLWHMQAEGFIPATIQ
jgi:ATP-binding cassette subfamily B protein